DIRSRTAELAGELGIADRLSDQIRHLSGGLSRRADLARALIAYPRVLLLDEPTTGLDIDARRSFWNTLGRIRNRLKMTVILATHLIDEAGHADRVVMMRDGRTVRDGSPDDLRALLGSRVLRLHVPRDADLSTVRAWLDHSGIRYAETEGLIIGADADPALAAACPIEDAAVTIAPPTLEDVYTYFAGSAVEPTAGRGVLA
ncbi:MAG: ATP-binding cassette domain-containing protein, partial [Phycisphaerales bacterium]